MGRNPSQGNEAPPSALARRQEIARLLHGRRAALFLDYDGTLTPIVATPEEAVLGAPMRALLEKLATRCPVAIISGRDLRDVRALVGLPRLSYAGSHGFEISGPEGEPIEHQQGAEHLAALEQAEADLRRRLQTIPRARLERKRFSLAVHYRAVAPDAVGAVAAAVEEVARRRPELRVTSGKMVHDLGPAIDWHKGKAVLWLLRALRLEAERLLPIYLGDDMTDEAAFQALRGRGLGIAVMERPRPTAASYTLRDPGEVGEFLALLLALLEEGR